MTISDTFFYEHAPCGLLLTEGDGTILRSNDIFAQWLDYDVAELEKGIKFQQLLTVGARIFHQTHWLPLIQLRGSVSEVKLDFKHADGHRLSMLVNARAHTLPDGRPCHSIAAMVATDRDSYERELVAKRTEAIELLRKHRLLEDEALERSRFAEQLVGIVSHDLRNPLTAIRMGTEMLVLKETDPKRLQLASRVHQAVDRAMLLIDDLLDFTLTKTGRAMPINIAALDLHDVIAQGVEELRLAFPSARIEHQRKGNNIVDGDTIQLTRVLGNLVANAVRYGDGSQPIRIITDTHAQRATLTVCNAGYPISPTLLPNLFEAMTRGDFKQGGGVGLGLYIVNQIALAHGGRSMARSDETETCIGIEFPAHALASATDSDVTSFSGEFTNATEQD